MRIKNSDQLMLELPFANPEVEIMEPYLALKPEQKLDGTKIAQAHYESLYGKRPYWVHLTWREAKSRYAGKRVLISRNMLAWVDDPQYRKHVLVFAIVDMSLRSAELKGWSSFEEIRKHETGEPGNGGIDAEITSEWPYPMQTFPGKKGGK